MSLMKVYRVIMSFEVDAQTEEEACHNACDMVWNGIVEAVVEVPQHVVNRTRKVEFDPDLPKWIEWATEKKS